MQTFRTEGGIYELASTLAYAPKPYLALALGYHFLFGRDRTINERGLFAKTPRISILPMRKI